MKGDSMEYGIQMFSVRDLTEKDLPGALKKMAEIGYKNVEFAGFFGYSAEDVKKMLEENDLKVSGTHSSLKDLIDDFEGTVAYHKALGNKNYILPGVDFSCKEKIDENLAYMNEFQEKLAKEGMTLGYHNHDHEFKPTADGLIPYDELLKRTNVKLEIDTYWVYAAGKDPVALMEELRDRLFVIHIKDGFSNREGMPLGRGTAPVREVYKKAVEMGIPMVVESETLTPDGVTEAEICFDYLKELERE